MSIDAGTSRFYDGYAARLAAGGESPRSAMLPVVLAHLTPGAAVLDVGCGSGRDVAALLGHGFNAFGVEPNDTMRDRAVATFPQLAGRVRPGLLPGLGQPFSDLQAGGFDAVVCSAVLMHLDPGTLTAALLELVAPLRPTALHPAPQLFLSLPEMQSELLCDGRDTDGRRFFNHATRDVEQALRAAGLWLHHHHTSDAALQSAGTRWHTLVFRAAAG